MDPNALYNSNNTTPKSELPVLCLNSTLEDLLASESNLRFVKEPSGLVLFKKRELESLLSARHTLVTRLNLANRQVTDLEEQLLKKKETPSQINSNREDQMQAFVTLTNERRDLQGEIKVLLDQL